MSTIETDITPVKLTKAALNRFITWSKSRYNDYCGYGTKAWNVDRIYKALTEGNYKGETTFFVECASPVGESGSGRYWKTKGGGGKYTVNCVDKTISEEITKRFIKFI